MPEPACLPQEVGAVSPGDCSGAKLGLMVLLGSPDAHISPICPTYTSVHIRCPHVSYLPYINTCATLAEVCPDMASGLMRAMGTPYWLNLWHLSRQLFCPNTWVSWGPRALGSLSLEQSPWVYGDSRGVSAPPVQVSTAFSVESGSDETPPLGLFIR